MNGEYISVLNLDNVNVCLTKSVGLLTAMTVIYDPIYSIICDLNSEERDVWAIPLHLYYIYKLLLMALLKRSQSKIKKRRVYVGRIQLFKKK